MVFCHSADLVDWSLSLARGCSFIIPAVLLSFVRMLGVWAGWSHARCETVHAQLQAVHARRQTAHAQRQAEHARGETAHAQRPTVYARRQMASNGVRWHPRIQDFHYQLRK